MASRVCASLLTALECTDTICLTLQVLCFVIPFCLHPRLYISLYPPIAWPISINPGAHTPNSLPLTGMEHEPEAYFSLQVLLNAHFHSPRIVSNS